MMDRTEIPKPKRLSLKLNFSWMLLGVGIDVLCRFGVVVAIGKLLDPGAMGIFGLAMAIVVPTFQISTLDLRIALATDIGNEFPVRSYFHIGFVMALIAGLVVIVITLWIVSSGVGMATVLILAAARFFETRSEHFYGLFQRHERMDVIARSRILRAIVGLVLFVVALLVFGTLHSAVVGLAISAAGVFIFHDKPISSRFIERDETTQHEVEPGRDGWMAPSPPIGRLFVRLLPLGLTGALASSQTHIPRYLVEHFEGLQALGFYFAIFSLASGLSRVFNALGQSASARLARQYHQGHRRPFIKSLLLLGLFAIAVHLSLLWVCALFGSEILTLAYKAEYAVHDELLFIVMIGATIRNLAGLGQFGVLAARRYFVPAIHHSMVVTVTVLSGMVLITDYGLIGAGYLTVVSASAHLLGILGINLWFISRMPQTLDK